MRQLTALFLIFTCSDVIAAKAKLQPDIVLERVGQVVIEPANHYSENTRIHISLRYPRGHPHAGKEIRHYRGPILIEEWRTQVYDGRYGATLLPVKLHPRKGRVELTLKSLARFTVYDQRNAPVPQIAVRVGSRYRLLEIPQWVDQDGNDKTDWLEARVENILRRARSSKIREVTQVVGALAGWKESYKRDCGGVSDEEPLIASISPACLDWDGSNLHRLDSHRELTATVLHETRHVWVHRYHVQLDHQKLQKLVAANTRPDCDPAKSGHAPCMENIQDSRYADQEADAEAFANRYKKLIP